MLIAIHPKLPMRNKNETKTFYFTLGFRQQGGDYEGYLMMAMDNVEIHFFEFKALNPAENYGQGYIRVSDIEQFYQSLPERKILIHPNGGHLETKSWRQQEFSLLDPDNNLLTFGQ